MTAAVQRNTKVNPVGNPHTLGDQYRNHAVGCIDDYDHFGSCRPMGETLMPDDRKSEHDVPIRDVPFVKVSNRPGFTTAIVHIEAPNLPYGGESPTLCGRLFKAGTYFWPSGWNHAPRYVQWTTCGTCHKRAVAEGIYASAMGGRGRI